jgi:hypothetical protein
VLPEQEASPLHSIVFSAANISMPPVHVLGPVHFTSQLLPPHTSFPAQESLSPHSMLHAAAVQSNWPQDFVPHFTLQSLPPHFTRPVQELPVQSMSQLAAPVQSTPPWHAPFSHFTLQPKSDGQSTRSGHGLLSPAQLMTQVSFSQVPRPACSQASSQSLSAA